MARRHQHEEHQNHEAWAVPYGDLVTLLLAFFVVMYAISSVNEGKYRAVSDALSSAFGGPPRSINPIQLGETQLRGSSFDRPSLLTPGAKAGPTATSPVSNVRVRQMLDAPLGGRQPQAAQQQAMAKAAMDASLRGESQLNTLGRRIQHALAELVREKLVTVRRGPTFLEVEIQSDILFASGVAAPSPVATSTVRKLGAVLREEPNAVRVEGYTDDVPIRTAAFPTNWELSSARAASVVHVLIGEGVDPGRLAVVGYGEHQPAADNATVEGRNANRRVLLVILAAPQAVDAVPEAGPQIALDAAADGATDPVTADAAAIAAPAPHAAALAAPDSHAGAH
ncbi:flagellar motor protein MotD [Luteimonas kalidii]|uniref:Flagellar motor protein MotD n=1 Tax=Luteimonas kalidii TaxID=3042025 RepID=A0ABT6JW54_9GAMM|nr:flagellar motor protein MotD [Luteimonas kalidii]MDH5834926.1 flagellar motor protein MotD [Luteimonas kalidii]